MPAKLSHLMTVSQEHAMQTGTFDVSVGQTGRSARAIALGPGGFGGTAREAIEGLGSGDARGWPQV